MLCSQQKRTRCCSIHPGFRVGGANTIKSHGNSNDKGPSPRHPILLCWWMDSNRGPNTASIYGIEKRNEPPHHRSSFIVRFLKRTSLTKPPPSIHPSIRLFSPQSLMMIQVIRKAFHINSSACGHTHQNKKEWIFISFRFDCLSCLPVLYALPAWSGYAGCRMLMIYIIGSWAQSSERGDE